MLSTDTNHQSAASIRLAAFSLKTYYLRTKVENFHKFKKLNQKSPTVHCTVWTDTNHQIAASIRLAAFSPKTFCSQCDALSFSLVPPFHILQFVALKYHSHLHTNSTSVTKSYASFIVTHLRL